MKTAFRIATVSFLVTAAAIKAAPAFSEPVQPQNVSVVRTADLDLTTVSGKRELQHRLVIAASEVCGTAADVDLAGRNDVRQCRADVLETAHANSERLASRSDGTILVAARRR